MSTIVAQICIRRDTAANFTSANPTLALGEIAYETDTRNIKVGDGATAWTALGYINPYRGGTAAAPTSNTVLGSGAGVALTGSSLDNTLLGFGAGANVTGIRQVSIGYQAGSATGAATEHVNIGWQAGQNAASGNRSVHAGFRAGWNNGGSNNVAIGGRASQSTCSNVVAVGSDAALFNTASDITAVGANALDANTTGTGNVAVGKDALGSCTTAPSNIAIGNEALRDLTTGFGSNVGIGPNAGRLISTGNSVIGIGLNTLSGHSSINRCVAIGTNAATAVQNASDVVAIGPAALFVLNSANNTIAIGGDACRFDPAGNNLSSATNSIFIGTDTRPAANTQTNQIVIGDQGRGNGSNTTTIGNSSTTGTFIPAGNLTLTNGNFIVGTSGKGIDFSATSHAGGMTSELLSDYEEGTFTPTVSSGVTTPTYTTQTGWYTKIGRMVYFMVRIDLSGGTANANQLKLGGLPFTSNSSADLTGGGHWTYTANLLAANTSALPHVFVAQSSTEVQMFGLDGNQFLGTSANNLNNLMTLQGFYYV